MKRKVKINKNSPLKVVYNATYGEYKLSEEALKMLDNNENLERHHPKLVEVVEKLVDKASGDCCGYDTAKLAIHELSGIKYYIEEYDGLETVIEPKDMIDA